MKRAQESEKREDDQLLHHMRRVKASATIQKKWLRHIRGRYGLIKFYKLRLNSVKHLVL